MNFYWCTLVNDSYLFSWFVQLHAFPINNIYIFLFYTEGLRIEDGMCCTNREAPWARFFFFTAYPFQKVVHNSVHEYTVVCLWFFPLNYSLKYDCIRLFFHCTLPAQHEMSSACNNLNIKSKQEKLAHDIVTLCNNITHNCYVTKLRQC